MTNTLQGQTVVVLGGTSGIGLATAKAAAGLGASVVVTSSRQTKVDRTVAELGPKARGFAADLAQEAQISALFAQVGALDHLVYTAGDALTVGPLATLDLAAVRKAFEVRVFGAMAAVKAAAPLIRKGGSITLTHGLAGQRPLPGWTVGATVCGAMESFTRALAVELAPLRVNAVMPGFVRTPLWSDIPEADRNNMYEQAGAALLVRRIGEPEDIAAAYLYLMSNGFTSGQTIVVDGGNSLT